MIAHAPQVCNPTQPESNQSDCKPAINNTHSTHTLHSTLPTMPSYIRVISSFHQITESQYNIIHLFTMLLTLTACVYHATDSIEIRWAATENEAEESGNPGQIKSQGVKHHKSLATRHSCLLFGHLAASEFRSMSLRSR